MDYSQEYKQKLVSADEAVKLIKSGDWVDYGWCNGTVDVLDQALAKRTDELKNVNLRGGILLKPLAVFAREDAGEHFTWNSWHMSGIERKLIARGCAYYSPIRYSELPRYYRESSCPDDVAMIMVAPMDKHGYFNFGPNASHLGAMCETAKHVIVEVNENMPRCLGGTECGIHISDVTYIVEGNNAPIGELGAGGPATDVDKKVAQLIVDQIPNGACLQLGIGGMPNAVGSLIAESDLKDLGVHTEMYVDAFVDIARADSYVGSRQYINSHSYVYYSHTMFSSIIINSLKLFSAVPFAISSYSVYYWGWVCKLSELTSAGLLCFMFSLGLSVVFFGLMVHYWISLALAPYIMTLNPRTNIFDACDLSVRLMDGQHGRYISFLLSFVMYIPALLLVYPVFIIYPYFRLSYIVFLQDIMGSYWQDKMPSMIKRWRKYSK